MIHDWSVFASLEEIKEGSAPITFGNNEIIYTPGRGDVEILSKSGGSVTLTDVFYVPRLGKNLLPIGSAASKGVKVILIKDSLKMFKNRNTVIAKG